MLKLKYCFVLILIAVFSAVTFADDGVDTETLPPANQPDEAQPVENEAAAKLGESSFAETEKRGLTFWKLTINPKAAKIKNFPEFYKDFLDEVNAGVRLKRFNILDIEGLNPEKNTFMSQLKAYYDTHIREIVESRAKERGKGYKDEARTTVLTKQMFDQVIDSAYVWTITIKEFDLKLETRMLKERVPNQDGTFTEVEVPHRYWKGFLSWQIDYYKFNMKENKPLALSFIQNIKDSSDRTIEILPLVNSQQWRDLEPAQQQQIVKNARDNVWDSISPSSNWIEKKTKEIFIFIAKILSRVEQNIYARPGRADGMRVDDGFYVIDSNQKKFGYSKIRHLGLGYIEAGNGATKAEQDQSRLQIIKGDEENIFEGLSILENPMMGGEFDLSFGYNLLMGYSNDAGQFTYSDGIGGVMTFPESEGTAALTLQFLYDLGRDIEVPEFWFGLELNIGFGDFTTGIVDLVFLKRVYFKQLNIEYGGGIGGFFGMISDENDVETINVTGFTAKACFSVGYFIAPSFEIFARADFRFVFATLSDFESEGGTTYTPINDDNEISFNTFAPGIEFGIRILF